MAESTNAVKKWIWTVIVGCVGVILLFLIFLPTILSSDAGTRFLIRRVENQTGGTLTVRNLQLSWLGEQKIDALQFQEGKGFLLTFDTLTSDCSFWNLLFRRGSVGKTQINNLHISAYPKVSEEKVAALKEVGKKAKKPKGEFWSDFRGHLILSNGRVTIQNGVSIYAINVNLELDKTSAFKVEGKARRNEQLGNFYGEGKQSPLWEGGMTFTNVPVEGLDQIVALIRPKSQGLLLALLGDTINAQLQSIPTPEGLSLACDVNSPRLRVDLKPTYQEGVFRLETPGRIALTVKPLLFNTFSKEVVLQNDAQTELRIEKASLPLMKQKLNLAKGSGEGNLYFSKGQLLLTQVQEILEVNELNANFSTSALGELINLTLRSAMRYQKEAPSSVNGTLAIQNLLKKPTFPQLDLNIQNLPLALIDSFNKSSLVTYLGNTYSGKVVKSENQFTVSGKTPLLSLEKTSLKIDTNAVLTEPANFSYQITPKLYKELARPFPVQGIIHTLLLPLSKEGLVFKKANFNLTLNAGAIESKNLLGLGAASLPSLQATLQGTSLESAQFAISTFLDYHEQTWGYAILGDQVGVKASGRASFDKELEVSPLDLSIDGRKFKGDIAAAIEKHTLILKKGIQVNFLLEPSQLNPILSKDNAYPLLVKTTPLELQIKPSQIPLKEETLSALSVKGVGKVADLEMVNPANRYPFNFKDVEIDFDLDGKKNSHTIHFEGEALENQQKAGKLTLALSGTGKASELITSPDTVKASLSSFSSQIADVFFKTRGQLPDLIGPTLNLNYEMGKVGDRQQLDMQIDSPGLTLDGAFYGGKNLELKSPRKPLRIRWDLS
ncbi:MAG: hypothetical protein KDK64_00005, partial [Chlamydiia bacterium]|nr:hypothetical protein [Chlamydiia bacterium]